MSERQKQYSTDEARGRYWHQMLNMADDDLDPYAYRLLGHYIRVDGCWETVRTTALTTRMSVGKVVKTRNALQDGGWINVELSEHDTYLITVIDRMKENVERYERLAREKKARSRGEHALNGVHEVNNDVHVVKNRKFKRVHEVKQRITEEPREEELKDIASTDAQASQSSDDPLIDDGIEDDTRDASKPLSRAKVKIPSVQGDEQNHTHAGNVKGKTKATTPPPPTPSPTAAMAEALGAAWGVMPTSPDYGLYVKKAKKLIAGGVPVELFKAYCDHQKDKAGAFADKLTLAGITEGGRLSEFAKWWAVEGPRVQEKARITAELAEQNRLARINHPDWFPDYEPPNQASPERVQWMQDQLRSMGADI